MACTVCTEPLFTRDDVYTSECGHILHKPCWISCLNSCPLCPVCRKPTTLQKLIRLFITDDDEEVVLPLSRKIDALNSQVTALKQEGKLSEEKICNEQKMNTSLREQLEKIKETAVTDLTNLSSVRQKLYKERKARIDANFCKEEYRKKYEALLKTVEESNTEIQDANEYLRVSKEETNNLRSQILTLKMGAGRNNPSESHIEAREFQKALQVLDVNMNNLKRRLQQ